MWLSVMFRMCRCFNNYISKVGICAPHLRTLGTFSMLILFRALTRLLCELHKKGFRGRHIKFKAVFFQRSALGRRIVRKSPGIH